MTTTPETERGPQPVTVPPSSGDGDPGRGGGAAVSAPDRRRDPRPRRVRMLGPLVTLGALGAATAYVGLVDPGQPGHYPGCPFLALTGLDCPACGGLRAVHALAHGNVVAALDHNLLAVLAAPIVAVLWLLWVRRAWLGYTVTSDPRVVARRNRTAVVVTVVLLAFWLVRNLPFAEYLRSTVSG